MAQLTTHSPASARYRFGVFEADAATGELRKQGVRIKVTVQPFQVLLMLLARPGELFTREQLAAALWPDGTFVDFEHGVNSAINRIREALGDSARNPRFIETLARRGYRFIAPVELVGGEVAAAAEAPVEAPVATLLAAPHELPRVSHRAAQMLFAGLQLMYLGFYVGALANLPEIEELFAGLGVWVRVVGVSAGLLVPVRLFLLTAVAMRPPGFRARYLRLWPYLLAPDFLWALAPFLLLHHLALGLAVACTAPLVYAPFAQRSLILMGAAEGDPEEPRVTR